MGKVSVTEIMVTPLKRIQLEGGDVLHGMRQHDPGYINFGEAYFSIIDLGAIKAWKRHLRMTLNIVVPVGSINFVFIDDEGVFREEAAGVERYVRLTIPPGIWFGFKGICSPYSMLLNIADIPHNPAEVERKSLGEIKFNWELKE
jgi:dTDP-4-dehydrorhamnose 3,5-epimerase